MPPKPFRYQPTRINRLENKLRAGRIKEIIENSLNKFLIEFMRVRSKHVRTCKEGGMKSLL